MTESAFNPYQSPVANCDNHPAVDGSEGQARPACKLCSVGSITLATVLGSAVAGGVLMTLNYNRLGRRAAAIHAVVWAVVCTAAILAAGTLLPDDAPIPNSVCVVPPIIAMYWLAKSLQGPAVEKHQAYARRTKLWSRTCLPTSRTCGKRSIFTIPWTIGVAMPRPCGRSKTRPT